MAITISQIGDLLARFGNEIVNDQVNLATPFVGNGHIQKIKHAHEQGIVRIRETDGLASTGQLSDGAGLPDGENVSFQSGSYLPKIFFTRLWIPRGAAHLAAGGRDGVRLVREELEVAGRQLGKVLGQAVFRAPICSFVDSSGGPPPVVPATGTTRVVTATDEDFLVTTIAGLYEGQTVQIVDNAGALLTATVKGINYNMNQRFDGTEIAYTAGAEFGVFGVQITFTAGATIGTFGVDANNELDQGSATNVGTLSIVNRGPESTTPSTLQANDPMISLNDAYGNASLYGISNSAYTGTSRTVNGPLTGAVMRDVSTAIKRRAGYGWHMLVMNSNMIQNYFENVVIASGGTSALNYLPGQTTKDIDGGATVPTFQGMPIVIDENVDDHLMYYFNKDDIKLAEFKQFSPDQDSSNAHGMVDRSRLIYDTQIWGMYNMRVTRRNSGGMLNGVTNA